MLAILVGVSGDDDQRAASVFAIRTPLRRDRTLLNSRG